MSIRGDFLPPVPCRDSPSLPVTGFLDRCFDLRTHRADDSTVTLEYASVGRAVATGRPYGNHYISVVTIKDRKLIHWRDYLDPLRVFEALGVNG